jgi:CDP-paratose 2-epimerase
LGFIWPVNCRYFNIVAAIANVFPFTMRILITGICGFTGSTLALAIRENLEGTEIFGCDNFVRPGSEVNRVALRNLHVPVHHADLRNASDIDALPKADWIIDAAANPSVLAGVDGVTSSRQLVEHNLAGTINMLEYCKKHRAGFVLLSTSRVYSIPQLSSLKVQESGGAYRPVADQNFPAGISVDGVSENYTTAPPVSLYGSTKLGSECLALEYGIDFDFPVWINRCGVLAGAGQFGRPDQGIFSYWINAWLRQRPLSYIGFNGRGWQVRDCLHPRDLMSILRQQMDGASDKNQIVNISGGVLNSMSLAQLSAWCQKRFGPREIAADSKPRPFDIPWMVLDTARAAREWRWQVETPLEKILDEIAGHAEKHPNWLELSGS